jgi:hypothetical protein
MLLEWTLKLGFTIPITKLHLDEVVFVKTAHIADAL